MDQSGNTVPERKEKGVYRSPVKEMFDKFANHKDVSLIYGEPVIHEKACIVPVAKMNYRFGAGGGGGTNTKKGELGQGEGGGGLMSVKPLGVYEMTNERVRFKPVIDLKFILMVFSVLTLGAASLLLRKD